MRDPRPWIEYLFAMGVQAVVGYAILKRFIGWVWKLASPRKEIDTEW